MKTLLLLIALGASSLLCNAQQNLLFSNKESVKEFMTTKGAAWFKQETYTNDGVKVLMFNYPLNSPIILAAFYFTDKGICNLCVYSFKNDLYLNGLVDSLKENKEFKKLPDKFVFVNESNNFYIKFLRENEFLTMAFNPIKL